MFCKDFCFGFFSDKGVTEALEKTFFFSIVVWEIKYILFVQSGFVEYRLFTFLNAGKLYLKIIRMLLSNH